MPDLTNLVFLAAIAFLFVHELDAIQQHEWRFFFAWTGLSDAAAYQLFTALHVPLFIAILANLQTRSVQIGLDLFLIVHAVLHTLLRNHPLITFNNGVSRLWIYGAALLGVVHLALLQAG
ncbi:MAG: hypothetical protein JNJ61_18030 [Anaerolineae bacterium]|nr:hypothetical protein [Anaerolineae bacterium]